MLSPFVRGWQVNGWPSRQKKKLFHAPWDARLRCGHKSPSRLPQQRSLYVCPVSVHRNWLRVFPGYSSFLPNRKSTHARKASRHLTSSKTHIDSTLYGWNGDPTIVIADHDALSIHCWSSLQGAAIIINNEKYFVNFVSFTSCLKKKRQQRVLYLNKQFHGH